MVKNNNNLTINIAISSHTVILYLSYYYLGRYLTAFCLE